MENLSEEEYFLEKAEIECETIKHTLQDCLDTITKLNQKFNQDHFTASNEDVYQQLSLKILQAPLSSPTKCEKSLSNTNLSICASNPSLTSIEDETETNSPSSTPVASRSASRTSMSLTRTPSDIVQSQNDVRVKLIKTKRAIESVLTTFELIFAKYDLTVYRLPVHLKKK